VFLKAFTLKWYLSAHHQVRMLSNLIKPGDYCLDIGANLGYFTIPISLLAGTEGKVYAVEPVPLFREVLAANIKKFSAGNVEIVPYALGENDGQEITMGTPRVDGVVRHGRTEVLDTEGEPDKMAVSHKAIMKNPAILFNDLPRLNYVKCDVEGYELHIVPHLLPLLSRYKPVIEMEVGPTSHKQAVIEYLQPLGYKPFFLQMDRFVAFELGEIAHRKEIELYFFPEHELGP
jgi:FkbM family methyltransferase